MYHVGSVFSISRKEKIMAVNLQLKLDSDCWRSFTNEHGVNVVVLEPPPDVQVHVFEQRVVLIFGDVESAFGLQIGFTHESFRDFLKLIAAMAKKIEPRGKEAAG
jgi:hypothetical protein